MNSAPRTPNVDEPVTDSADVSENNYYEIEVIEDALAVQIGIDSVQGSAGDSIINLNLNIEATDIENSNDTHNGNVDETNGQRGEIDVNVQNVTVPIENIGQSSDNVTDRNDGNHRDIEGTEASSEITEEVASSCMEQETNASVLNFTILSASQSLPNFDVSARSSWTVKDLKDYLTKYYPGNPPIVYQKLIFAGNNLKDGDTLQDVVDRNQRIHRNSGRNIFHLVVVPPELRVSDDDDDGADDMTNNVDEDSDDLDDELNDEDQDSDSNEDVENRRPLRRNHLTREENLLIRALARVRNGIAGELLLASRVPTYYNLEELMELHSLQNAYINFVRLNLDDRRRNRLDSIRPMRPISYWDCVFNFLQRLFTTHRTFVIFLIIAFRLFFSTFQFNIFLVILFLSCCLWCLACDVPVVNRPFQGGEQHSATPNRVFGSNRLRNALLVIERINEGNVRAQRRLVGGYSGSETGDMDDFIFEAYIPQQTYQYSMSMLAITTLQIIVMVMMLFAS